MSALYNLEPQPTAKVLLNTTSGDLVVEIFAKQVPLAARNFLQHCLNGYYNGTIFHRLVPGFIIQGGDPTGTGSGGVSAINDGAPFQDEFHSRLKFNRRGLLGMANSGDKNDNTSQFFFTLDKTPELQDKNTMFGRIEGDTIYNLMKMAEADLTSDDSDRPLYPTSIVSTEILLNPFNDMVKQASFATVTTQESAKAPKKKRKAQKTLLSFGGDDGEEAAAPVVKKVKVNPNFTAPDPQQPSAQEEHSTTKAVEQPKREKAVRRKSPTPSPSPPPPAATRASQAPLPPTNPQRNPSPSPSPEPRKLTALERTNAEIASLKASMKRTTTQTSAPEKKLSALESMIPASSTRGRKRGRAKEDASSLSSFNAFKARLEKLPAEKMTASPATATSIPQTTETTQSSALDTEEKLCDLHFIANCQSCGTWHDDAANAQDEDDNDTTWMSHALSFAKDTLGKDLEWKRKMEEFEVIDPREKTREIVGDKGAKKGGKEGDRAREREKKVKGRA
ncbi:cyclophilin-like protein [Aureobasidium subglaciale]|nr:cyclophilin-like protein [Aureobasidium subglaciale]